MARRCDLTGRTIQSGNNVSHANNRTRRRFLPNLQNVSLYSEALQRTVRFRATVYAIRSVEHRGGLDAFLKKAPNETLSLHAQRVKRRILKTVPA